MLELELYLRDMGARPSAGSEWVMDCPFCSKSGHLYVHAETDDDGPAGRWVCFKCGTGSRSFVKLLAELENIDIPEAHQRWAKLRIGGPAKPITKLMVAAAREKALATAKPAAKVDGDAWLPPEYQPLSMPDGRWLWPSYLNPHDEGCDHRCKSHRAVPKSLARQFKLGLCHHGEYATRIIFPIECPTGRSFTARSVLPPELESLRYKSGPDAGRLLFGWASTEGWSHVVITEGPFDALRAIEAGLPAVAILGKRLRDPQRDLLRRFARVTVLLDADARDDALDAGGDFPAADVRVASLPSDPGDATPEQVREAVRTAVPHDVAANEARRKRLGFLGASLR